MAQIKQDIKSGYKINQIRFIFRSENKPSLVNVDADKVLLCKKTDNKTADEFEQQYKYAGNYMDRKEALEYFADNKLSNLALGLNDKYHGLRLFTLEKIEESNGYTVPAVLSTIEQIADKDPDKLVQAKALEILVKVNDKKYEPLFNKYVNDSSYSVSGQALDGLVNLEPEQAYTLVKKYSADAKGKLGEVVSRVIMENPTEDDFDLLLENYKSPVTSQEEAIAKIRGTATFAGYLSKLKNDENVRKGVDEIMNFRNQIPPRCKEFA